MKSRRSARSAVAVVGAAFLLGLAVFLSLSSERRVTILSPVTIGLAQSTRIDLGVLHPDSFYRLPLVLKNTRHNGIRVTTAGLTCGCARTEGTFQLEVDLDSEAEFRVFFDTRQSFGEVRRRLHLSWEEEGATSVTTVDLLYKVSGH